ncbi:MAG: hypothetical protein ACTSQG_01460 [Promethearchaeota archaeon]
MKRQGIYILISGIFLFIIVLSIIPQSSNNFMIIDDETRSPRTSASLEGYKDILITDIERKANLSNYGLLNIIDKIKVENKNSNPITAIFIGVPLAHSEDLIFFEATGEEKNTLIAERSNMVMNDFEMIAIYFDTPLKPQEKKTIRFVQSYKDLLLYSLNPSNDQEITYHGYVYPILPYKIEGKIIAKYFAPESSTISSVQPWGKTSANNSITFDFSNITPFLENLGEKQNFTLIYKDNSITKLEVIELTREIFVSPWNILKVKEEYSFQNKGEKSISYLEFQIPGECRDIKVYDDLGEILGVEINPKWNYTGLKHKDLTIDLSENRVTITPNSKFKLTIEYNLISYQYYSQNWFLKSVQIDMLTTTFDYMGRDITIKFEIDGCLKIDSMSDPPDSIESGRGTTIIEYYYDYLSSYEKKEIQFTFVIDLFDMLIRPVSFALLIALLCSAYVLYVKSKKEGAEADVLKKDILPLNEIREFCSLYEEKNALFLEIRQAEEDTKRKKIAKKKYRNILNKNTAKIEEIEKEIIPFRKIVMEISETFENIIKRLEILEAERVSVKDSLNLLETRYKRGRLPSRAAYIKLADNFLRRRNKIDRSIDKLIQQLRSYLL